MKRLRPWLFCLLFLVLANLWIESYFSVHATELYPDKYLHTRATYRTEKEIEKMIQMVADDPNPKVVIVGDSFLWGTGIEGVTPSAIASEQLKLLLKYKYPDLHVWNLALPASHAADIYAILKRIIPLKPTALIVNTNYYFFSVPEEMNHMTYKSLLPVFKDDPDYKEILNGLHLNPIEYWLKSHIQAAIPVYHYKEEINLKFFKKPLGQDYIDGQMFNLYYRIKNAIPVQLEKGQVSIEQYRTFYDPHFIQENQINVIFAQKIAALLDEANIPTYLFSTPQNREVLGELVNNEIFDTNMKMIDQLYQNHSFLYEDLQDQIDPKYQRDNIHLTVEGNKLFAELLYDRITTLFKDKGVSTQ